MIHSEQPSGMSHGNQTKKKEENIMLGKIAPPKLIGALFVLGFAPLLSAQLNSAQKTITVTAQGAESISIALTAGGPVSLPIPTSLGQVTAGNVVPAWTTSWVLSSSRTSVKVYVYFASAIALQGLNSANTIPAVDFIGQANGGSMTPFLTSVPTFITTGGAGMLVSSTAINSGNLTGSKNDSLAVFLTSPGTQLSDLFATDTYTGVLNIVAQATP